MPFGIAAFIMHHIIGLVSFNRARESEREREREQNENKAFDLEAFQQAGLACAFRAFRAHFGTALPPRWRPPTPSEAAAIDVARNQGS